jgi:predicted DNA-binding ArsR family transcriptional regulator
MTTATELLAEYEQFRAKCVKFIQSEAEKAGGVTNLSRNLGYDPYYIDKMLKRSGILSMISCIKAIKLYKNQKM